MNTKLITLVIVILINTSVFGQEKQKEFTVFEIPAAAADNNANKNNSGAPADNCESCSDVLDPALRSTISSYKRSNLKDWLFQYFKSDEEQRGAMKNRASNDATLSAVVKTLPISFGYSSSQSKDFNYWNKKYIEWKNTRLISTDDIVYLLRENSDSQISAWLECRKICGSAASHADNKIFLDIKKVREGKYDISLTNVSRANIKITEIQIDDVLEKVSGKNFKLNKTISNKGGSVIASYVSKSTLDVRFSMAVSYKILGTNDEETVYATYKLKPRLPDTPIGTIVATTLSYEQFLKANNIDNSDTSEQLWLPCDGRNIVYGSFMTKTPDLRGVFIRGANVMDVNENLHTQVVESAQKNPDNTAVGAFQNESILAHNHNSNIGLSIADRGRYGGSGKGRRVRAENNVINTSTHGGNENRPKNVTVLYLIRVR